jgi:hypothetical protein
MILILKMLAEIASLLTKICIGLLSKNRLITLVILTYFGTPGFAAVSNFRISTQNNQQSVESHIPPISERIYFELLSGSRLNS